MLDFKFDLNSPKTIFPSASLVTFTQPPPGILPAAGCSEGTYMDSGLRPSNSGLATYY